MSETKRWRRLAIFYMAMFWIAMFTFAIMSSAADAYPNIIHEKGTNPRQNMELVYTFPESYYQGVDKITFTNTPVRYGEKDKTGRYTINWWKFRNGDIYFYNGYIWVYGKQIKNYGKHQMLESLHHELCHIQYYVKDKHTYNNETHAINCILR